MTKGIWEKISFILGLLVLGVLFGVTIFAANIEIKDLDLWLHLGTGKFILEHGFVPSADVFSCTIAGKPWVNHEWLFQVLSYLVFERWGPEGIVNMQVLVVALTFLVLLFLGYSRERQLGVIFILLLIMLVYQTRFTHRPDIFSLLFFSLYIYILALSIDKKWSVPALFFIQVLWTNFHGFFFFGPFIVLIGIMSEFVKRRVRLPWEWNNIGRLEDVEYARLKKIFLFVVLACLINPLTIKGALYPLGVLLNISGGSKIFFKYIQELQPPIIWPHVFSPNYLYYKLLILLSFLSFVFNRRKIDIGDLLIWFVFLLFSLVALRNLIYFAFAAYFVCMTNLSSISFRDIIPLSFSDEKFVHITGIIVKVLLLLWMLEFGMALSNKAYFDFDKYEMKSEFGGVSLRSYPDKGVDFLVKNGIRGRFFNDFNSGAYLVGRCYPNIRVFIDGRTELYGPKFFKQYQKIVKDADKKTFDEVVDKYGLTGIFLNSVRSEISKKLLQLIKEEKKWKLVFLDGFAVIFLKDTPQNRPVIEKFEIHPGRWKVDPIDLKRLGARSVIPFQNVNKAYTLLSLGADRAALEEALLALKVSPGYIEPYKILGKVYAKREEYEKAFENFRVAAMIAPRHLPTRFNLALSYDRLGDYEGAVKQYKMILRYYPKSIKAHFLLAKEYIKNQKYEKALKTLTQARQMAPKAIRELLELGDMVFDAAEYETSKEIYTMALDSKKYLSKVHEKIGLCEQALGQEESAREEFKKAQALKESWKKIQKEKGQTEGEYDKDSKKSLIEQTIE